MGWYPTDYLELPEYFLLLILGQVGLGRQMPFFKTYPSQGDSTTHNHQAGRHTHLFKVLFFSLVLALRPLPLALVLHSLPGSCSTSPPPWLLFYILFSLAFVQRPLLPGYWSSAWLFSFTQDFAWFKCVLACVRARRISQTVVTGCLSLWTNVQPTSEETWQSTTAFLLTNLQIYRFIKIKIYRSIQPQCSKRVNVTQSNTKYSTI